MKAILPDPRQVPVDNATSDLKLFKYGTVHIIGKMSDGKMSDGPYRIKMNKQH